MSEIIVILLRSQNDWSLNFHFSDNLFQRTTCLNTPFIIWQNNSWTFLQDDLYRYK